MDQGEVKGQKVERSNRISTAGFVKHHDCTASKMYTVHALDKSRLGPGHEEREAIKCAIIRNSGRVFLKMRL